MNKQNETPLVRLGDVASYLRPGDRLRHENGSECTIATASEKEVHTGGLALNMDGLFTLLFPRLELVPVGGVVKAGTPWAPFYDGGFRASFDPGGVVVRDDSDPTWYQLIRDEPEQLPREVVAGPETLRAGDTVEMVLPCSIGPLVIKTREADCWRSTKTCYSVVDGAMVRILSRAAASQVQASGDDAKTHGARGEPTVSDACADTVESLKAVDHYYDAVNYGCIPLRSSIMLDGDTRRLGPGMILSVEDLNRSPGPIYGKFMNNAACGGESSVALDYTSLQAAELGEQKDLVAEAQEALAAKQLEAVAPKPEWSSKCCWCGEPFWAGRPKAKSPFSCADCLPGTEPLDTRIATARRELAESAPDPHAHLTQAQRYHLDDDPDATGIPETN